jgi:Cu-Zn family superoxide dismutase
MRKEIVILAGSLLVLACQKKATNMTTGDTTGVVVPNSVDTLPGAGMVSDNATADMKDSAGNDLGTLRLVDGSNGIVVSGELKGLPPGTYAIHVHTTGKCEPPFTSAGGHWNPTNKEHGLENPQGPHYGDMRNITAGSDSTIMVNDTTPGGSLKGTNALIDSDGAAVVVHAKADDYKSNPAGNAGARIACGVVTAG